MYIKPKDTRVFNFLEASYVPVLCHAYSLGLG